MNLKNKKICKVCSKEFYNKNGRSTLCSPACKAEQKRRNNISSWRTKKSPTNECDSVVCLLCGVKLKALTGHMYAEHKITTEEYKKIYLDAPVVSKSISNYLSELFRGENNPGYQHGGTLSSWSDKSVKHTAEEIEISKKKAKDNLTKEKRTTCIEYWLAKGYSLSEASELLSKRQRTFSFDICIEKHGEEQGKAIFAERQQKWQRSFKKINYSEISQKLFWSIYENIKENISNDDIFFAEFDKGQKSTCNLEYCLKLESTSVKPDFLILSKKKIIEFDGDYWHSAARGNQDRERKRDELLINSGFKVIHIRERDYKKDTAKILQQCMEFLNE